MLDRTQRPVFSESKRPVRVPLWDGWSFENGLIYDDAGNHYSQRDIQDSWQAGAIVDGRLGKASNITVLKENLKRRKLLATVPKVVFIYGEGKDSEEVVFDLSVNIDS